MTYYHEIITDKSWKILQELKRNHHFTLIGGWAVFLYAKTLKSKDIDIICGYSDLGKLKEHHDLIKNDRLRKYEIHIEEVDVDIYVPHFSDLGAPVDKLLEYTNVIEGFNVLSKEALLITKQKAWLYRGHSIKGEKDRIDIIALLQKEIDVDKYSKLLSKLNLQNYVQILREVINSTKEAPELNLNDHQYSKLKKKIMDNLP